MRNLEEMTESQLLYRSRSYLYDYIGFAIRKKILPKAHIDHINLLARKLEEMAAKAKAE